MQTPRLTRGNAANKVVKYKRAPPRNPEAKFSFPFVVFSLTGDIFLYEQARRVIALLIAILRGCIDIEILDCIFDEEVNIAWYFSGISQLC